jgi:hypothetical protein
MARAWIARKYPLRLPPRPTEDNDKGKFPKREIFSTSQQQNSTVTHE